MEKMDNSTIAKDEENLSIIERIVQKTGNPKIAAVLALDLFLVGVDTVSNCAMCISMALVVGALIELISAIKYDCAASESAPPTRHRAILSFNLLLRQTSVAATSTIYQLSQNPDKQEMLYNELKRIMPDPRSPVDTKTLEQMPFLRACIKETLR